MSEQRRSTDERKLELIDAALKIIASRGTPALTTRTLAEHVGLSSGAIFRHFPSLEALLAEIVARVQLELENTFPPATLPPLRRLEWFIKARSHALGHSPGVLQLVLSDRMRIELPSNSSKRLAQCVKMTRAFVKECLKDGQKADSIRTDLPVEALVPIVVGTIHMIALALADDHPARAEEIRKSLLALICPATNLAPARARKKAPRVVWSGPSI